MKWDDCFILKGRRNINENQVELLQHFTAFKDFVKKPCDLLILDAWKLFETLQRFRNIQLNQ